MLLSGDANMEHAAHRPLPPVERSVLREGAWLGVLVASCIWLWIAIIDVLVGKPFQTFELLGGVAVGTLAHYALNILYATILVSAVRGSERAPSLMIAIIFGLLMLEVAFAMLTVMLGQAGLGNLAWIRIFGGSLLGLAIALALLSRRYPLATRLHEAEEER
jgi:hypothetical protein